MTHSNILTVPIVALGLLLPSAWASAGVLNDDLHLSWASRRDLTSSQFSDRFQEYRERGYIITDVDGYPGGGGTRYSMVWRDNKDGRGWAEWRNLSSSGYHEKWLEYRDLGYRPLDVEGYRRSGTTQFAGIWVENREGLGWASYRNMTRSQYDQRMKQFREQGLRAVDIEAYATSSGLRYAAIWVENRDGISWKQIRDATRSQYQAEVDAHVAKGFRVLDYESYGTSEGQRYAAIFEENPRGRAWVMRSDRTEVRFANYWREYRDQGYRLVDFERYETPQGTRYAGLWYENEPTRLRYPRAGRLDELILKYRSGNDLPGISVAIVRGGTMIYRRGFGEADRARNKAAHGGTVYLAASISKAIGGTLAVRLEAAKRIDLTQPTSVFLQNLPIFFFFTADLPAHHTHTVEQLLAHSACIWHYGEGPKPPERYYPNSSRAVTRIWNADLWEGCTIGATWHYSTHAYTFAAAAIERATGRTIDRLLREEITQPHGLSSMRVQWAEPSLPANYERAVAYNDNNSSTSYENNSWKVLGGGIETSAVDLARFGWRVLNGQIVDAATRDNRLWTRLVASHPTALGWWPSTHNGRNIVEHGGSARGARAHLRLYRDAGDDLSIAIMSNRRNHTNPDIDVLAGDIADLVLAP